MPNPFPLDLTDDATAAAVHRIGRAAYTVEAELIGFDGIPALRESLTDMRGRALTWLGAVTPDGTVAGFLAWQEEADGQISLDRLCVDPAWFRRGVASLLLRHALEELFPDRTVEVTTGADNTPAITLYTRLGFIRGADFSPAPGLRMASFARDAGTRAAWEGGGTRRHP
ncbi:GNAT family N-acetyltransferase [Streptomyces sp. NBC_00249]|uniref:GNAT family N-acetyltransferase n=1 Tax=Streptomyces sp. NBC_00249 TaxID=2975690 RepID=UPI00224EA363|nr:GNAT family N-acetyltransferase [Streptomyces sp. NBC_00249]MCX5197825.1 GNAT family N-acetyltransferase [Streptomyces sp. NBC_00249]